MTHARAGRAAAVTAAALLAASILASCTSDVQAVPESSASTSISPTTPGVTSPTPTPTETPADDPSNADSWVVSTEGIGPVSVTENFDDVLDEIEDTGVGPFDCDGVAYGFAKDNAYDIMVIKDRYDGTDDIVEVSVGWNGDTMGVGPRTAEGLGLGSTKQQVLGTYESAEEVTSVIANRSFVNIADDNGDGTLVFSYLSGYDGAVGVSVITGEEPAYEPCA